MGAERGCDHPGRVTGRPSPPWWATLAPGRPG